MQRATQRMPTLLETLRHSLLRLLGRGGEDAGAGSDGDNSPELVALGALERVLPGGIGEGELKEQAERVARAELQSALRTALEAHAARFDMSRAQAFLPRFRQLARGVRMESPREQPPTGGSPA
ncbi:hypothetical protein D9M73_277880 [compost metagenome]